VVMLFGWFKRAWKHRKFWWSKWCVTWSKLHVTLGGGFERIGNTNFQLLMVANPSAWIILGIQHRQSQAFQKNQVKFDWPTVNDVTFPLTDIKRYWPWSKPKWWMVSVSNTLSTQVPAHSVFSIKSITKNNHPVSLPHYWEGWGGRRSGGEIYHHGRK
jgi:hypothetical protein